MFGEYSQDERASIAMVVALSLPVEVLPVFSEEGRYGEKASSIDGQAELMPGRSLSRHQYGMDTGWNMALIENMCSQLDISTRKLEASFDFIHSVDKYRPLSTEERRSLSSPYCQHLFRHDSADARERRIAKLYVQILVFVVLLNKCDGRGRVLLRNLYVLLGLSPARYVWIESSLCQFLMERESALQHAKTKGSSKYRYAKIGAVALGAGAVLAVTGGLAAPAIAGALLLMGSSTAAAATLTGSSVMMVLFGSAGAGLAGYKMTRRTLGLTEFEFRTYGDPGRLAMVLMVAGFMENDEDDKRSFGVLPDELSLKERLTRYYSIHAPDRLEKVDSEVLCFEDDPQQLFDHLNSLYGKDPLNRDSFVEHRHAYPFEDAAEQQLYTGFIAEAIQHCLQQPKGTPGGCDRRRSTHGVEGDEDDQLMLTRDLGGMVRSEGCIDTAGSGGNLQMPLRSGGDESPISDAKEAVDGPQLSMSQKNDDNAAVGELGVDLGLSQTCWSWSELNISPMYELTILHWETRLLKQMGGTIHNLARSISTTAARKAVETTIMNLVALTAALPLYLLSVVNTIDSMWVIASERAAAAGKEMATALLSRPPGMRPITLIGYSIGAKVIFYCLKEIHRQLCMSDDMSPSTSSEELREAAAADDEDDDLQSGDPDWVSDDPTTRGSVTPSDRPGFVTRPTAAHDDSKSKPSYFGFFRRKSAASGPTTLVDAMNAKGGLIQDVVLLGCPINAKSRNWDKIRRLVSGRLINGYSTKDTLLSLVYRYEQMRLSIAGIQPVDIPGVENVDLSHIVQQHAHYSTKMAAILREIDLASGGT